MTLELTTLEFNHDPRGDPSSALNIRRNLDYEVPLPEYRRGRSTSAEDSKVAYAIAGTEGATVTVRATFTREAAEARAYDVRADGGGVLGPIGPRRIAFAARERSAVVALPLSRRRFEAVGRHDVAWSWRCRTAGGRGPWRPLTVTRHRVYLLLDVPGSPWTSDFGDVRNPWTDLLDFACVLARGVSDARAATRSTVVAVNSRFRLKYNIEDGSAGYYVLGFDLSRWIERVLRGRRSDALFLPGCPRERYWEDWVVNCYDCGGAVTLMATVLGARVGCRTQSPFGYLRLVRPIGRGPCNNPFYGCHGSSVVGPDGPRDPFSFHAFAVLDDEHYDACLRACVPWAVRVALILAWALVVLFTLGLVRPRPLLDRARGWLLGLQRWDYEQRVIAADRLPGATRLPGRPTSMKVPFR